MKNIWILAMISALTITTVFADDLPTIYREKGIAALEKGANDRLTDTHYWLEKLIKLDTRFGYFEKSDSDILVVDKSRLLLWRYKYAKGELSLENEINATLGDAKGDKFVEGDEKTPVGAYRITSVLTQETHKLDPYYGPLAFTTNYPNVFDKSLGKSGHGIWVHGFPLNSARLRDNTQGCVAIDNELLLGIHLRINPEKTVILINEEGVLEANKDDLASVLTTIFEWRYAWQKSDLKSYLSLYTSDFKRSDNVGRPQFDQIKAGIFLDQSQKTIYFSDIEIVPYPNSLGEVIYRARFWQDYQAKNHRSNRIKELYLRKQGDRFLIVTEH
ncbi:peptidase [Campylobacterota bacterium]|nr:peptidase [Campylobacterota bacterium]